MVCKNSSGVKLDCGDIIHWITLVIDCIAQIALNKGRGQKKMTLLVVFYY